LGHFGFSDHFFVISEPAARKIAGIFLGVPGIRPTRPDRLDSLFTFCTYDRPAA
jgi:hypothetical protein